MEPLPALHIARSLTGRRINNDMSPFVAQKTHHPCHRRLSLRPPSLRHGGSIEAAILPATMPAATRVPARARGHQFNQPY
jgi:hypothetical protein